MKLGYVGPAACAMCRHRSLCPGCRGVRPASCNVSRNTATTCRHAMQTPDTAQQQTLQPAHLKHFRLFQRTLCLQTLQKLLRVCTSKKFPQLCAGQLSLEKHKHAQTHASAQRKAANQTCTLTARLFEQLHIDGLGSRCFTQKAWVPKASIQATCGPLPIQKHHVHAS